MANTKKKISVLVPEQLPDFIKSDHPDFVQFLKIYYEFMESAELKLKTLGNNDSILNEEGTTTYILLEDDNPYRKNEKNTILLNDYDQTWQGGAAVGTPTVETPVGGDTLTGATRVRTVGSFINGETITGQTSKATATIRVEDINANSRIFISAQNKFLRDEQIIGATSNASAYIESYTANPVQNISDLLEYADVDDTIDAFFDQFKEAFMRTIPRKLATDITVTDEAGDTRLVNLEQRNILKNIKDLYRAKGTRRGHEIFFRLLLGENVELFYPNTNMLKVSDGKFDDPNTLRVVQVNDAILMENDENQQIYLVMEDGQHIEQEGSTLLTHDMNKLVGSTITQDAARDLTILEGQPHHPDTTVLNGFSADFVANVPTGGYTEIGKATATVESVTQIQLGSVILYDLILTEGSIAGTFIPGQRIYGQDNTNAARNILAKSTSMISSISMATTGQYFSTSDALSITSDVGIGAAVSIDAVSSGKISNIDISSVGEGYAIGDQITVVDTDTGGTGLSAEVSVVNGGIAPETGSVVDQFRFTLENEPGEFISEDSTDFGILLESSPVRALGTTTLTNGVVTGITITNGGSGYTTAPTITFGVEKAFIELEDGTGGDIINENDTGGKFFLEGGGTGATATASISGGVVSSVTIDSGGMGYIGNPILTFSVPPPEYIITNVEESYIGQEGTTSALVYFNQEEDYGMAATDHFVLEDQTVISDNTPGIKFIQEYGTGTGDITDVRVKGIGNNYTSLPTLTLPTTSTLRVRAARIIAEDSIDGEILFEDGNTIMMEHIGAEAFEVTQENVKYGFSVGETIRPVEQPTSTTKGTVVKHYDSENGQAGLAGKDYSYVEFTIDTGTISAGDTIEGLTSLVHAEVITTRVRSDGKVIAKGDGDIGKITSVKVVEPGIHYTELPTLSTVTNILITAPTAAFVGERTITGGTSGATATIVSYSTTTQLLKVSSVTGTFVADEVITESSSGTTATIISVDSSTFTSNIGALGVFAKYINEDGFISEDSMKIQDSHYYQDFSYVVKTATSITVWKDSLLSSVHPSGFALFSQINPVTPLNLRIKTSSTVPDLADARESFTPDLLSTLKTIFTTQLGRRLGGTAQTLSSAPLAGVPAGTAFSNDKDVSVTQDIFIDRYGISHLTALKGSGEAIVYPTITIAAGTGDSPYIGDGGNIRRNLSNFMFSNSHQLAVNNPSITFRSHPGFYEKREVTTLNGAINNSVTTIALTSAAQFPTAGTIVIDSEQISYTGKSGNNLTGCTRGANIQGTTSAASHADGVNVYNFKFITTENTGTSGSYHPANWTGLTLGQLTDLQGTKHNIAPPSEITITIT